MAANREATGRKNVGGSPKSTDLSDNSLAKAKMMRQVYEDLGQLLPMYEAAAARGDGRTAYMIIGRMVARWRVLASTIGLTQK